MKAEQLKEMILSNGLDDRFSEIYPTGVENQKERYVKALDNYMNLYGNQDVQIYSVPGRSEVIGNHTDHQQGEVMAASINLDIIAVTGKNNENFIKVYSDEYDIPAVYLDHLDVVDADEGTSAALIRGVAEKMKNSNRKLEGWNAYMTSDVLQGSGLSSSAAFEVMIGTIISLLSNEGSVDPVEIANIGQYAENVHFKKPCGLMDQSACSVGGLIHIDFKEKENPVVEKVDVNFADFDTALCITDVHASHADLTQDYADIPYELKEVDQYFNAGVLAEVDEENFYAKLPELRAHLNNDRALLRAIHVFEENKRVHRAVEALSTGEFDAFLENIKASGNSSFKFLQNIYSAHDFHNQAVSLALALSERVLKDRGASRVHGGGFAGTIQAFVPRDLVEEYRQVMDGVFGEGSCHVLEIRPYGGIQVF